MARTTFRPSRRSDMDNITSLLEKVASGAVSVKDAREALDGVELTEAQMDRAVTQGVFDPVAPGTVISARLAPSGASYLVTLLMVWGMFWVIYWLGTMLYGLFMKWDQQQLAFHLAMTLVTLMIMGIVYLKWVLPDTIVVKHRQNKYVPEHAKDWKEYKI